MSDKLVSAVAEMDYEQALALTRGLLAQGGDPMGILYDCRVAVEIVGKRFEEGQYFLPELSQAGEMLKDISAEVKPYFRGGSKEVAKWG